jgi:Xaa-Pro aminopeptidase
MNRRIEKLCRAMNEADIDGALITGLANVRYFTGFTGDESMALIDKGHCVFLTDFRYTEQAGNECEGFEVIEPEAAKPFSTVDRLCAEWGVKRLWVEEEDISLDRYRKLSGAMPDVLLMPNEGAVKSIRGIKEPEEIEAIRRAQEIAEKGLTHLLGYIKPGMTEQEAALELEFYTRREGSDGMSFPTIVAAGPHGAMPHAQLSDRMIQDGDMIVLDFGCRWGGYCSDMTRTVVMGKATDEMKKIYDLVLRAQEAALTGLKAGISEVAGDQLAREIIDGAGYAAQFGHGLGHGVGLEIHEAPRLSPLAKGVLEEGMVVTVEPGIYLPGKFGVRIEDFVVIKKDGIENLTKAPKELIEL